MKTHLDLLDLQILEGIGNQGPRNLSTVAAKLGIKDATLRARLRRLKPLVYLNANVYHTFIGLRKVCIFAKATLGKEKLLFESLKAPDFWLYVSRCYGEFEGCFALYAIPPENQTQFESLLETLKDKHLVENLEYFWSTCFHTVNPTTNWFDKQSNEWIFPWDKWVEEMKLQQTELPYSLKDPAAFPQKADYTDIFILKELEIDATISLKAIASKLDVTLQTIKYHFDNHIIKRQLLESFQVISFPFAEQESDFFFFIFTFPSEENMAKFANSLFNKPFVRSIGKIHGENGLFVQVYLPRKEFRRLIDGLSVLINKGFLKSYRYLIQDIRFISRQTVPYKLFDNGNWEYNQKRYLEELESLSQHGQNLDGVELGAMKYDDRSREMKRRS
jgi:DNA-binding Lrp family transcriptional regulator